ncbi:hypothetical protein BDZ89DRAFT_1138976 [Hymenopellis radicata]|nr:hypothetical protein BDZ89DRAFT_1138976 [Hymenopellis radicata]
MVSRPCYVGDASVVRLDLTLPPPQLQMSRTQALRPSSLLINVKKFAVLVLRASFLWYIGGIESTGPSGYQPSSPQRSPGEGRFYPPTSPRRRPYPGHYYLFLLTLPPLFPTPSASSAARWTTRISNEIAEAYLGEKVIHAVVTILAYVNDARR